MITRGYGELERYYATARVGRSAEIDRKKERRDAISTPTGIASIVTTLAMDGMFFFSDRLLHLQAVFNVAGKKSTVDVGYLWYLGCIIYCLIFGSTLSNVDGQKINSLLSVFIYHSFHFFAIFMFLLIAFLALIPQLLTF